MSWEYVQSIAYPYSDLDVAVRLPVSTAKIKPNPGSTIRCLPPRPWAIVHLVPRPFTLLLAPGLGVIFARMIAVAQYLCRSLVRRKEAWKAEGMDVRR